jgi:hypothetical protein
MQRSRAFALPSATWKAFVNNAPRVGISLGGAARRFAGRGISDVGRIVEIRSSLRLYPSGVSPSHYRTADDLHSRRGRRHRGHS